MTLNPLEIIGETLGAFEAPKFRETVEQRHDQKTTGYLNLVQAVDRIYGAEQQATTGSQVVEFAQNEPTDNVMASAEDTLITPTQPSIESALADVYKIHDQAFTPDFDDINVA